MNTNSSIPLKNSYNIILVLLIAISFFTKNIVYSCAFIEYDQYSWSLHPNLPFENFINGNLGILQPTYARIYLVIAYRYLINKPLNTKEKQETLNLITKRLKEPFQYSDIKDIKPYKDYIELRNQVIKSKLPTIQDTTYLTKFNYSSIVNIQPDALINATNILKYIISKYGLKSPYVIEWVKNQDLVFNINNDNSNNTIPKPLSNTKDANLIDANLYQIASANFYATNYDIAAKDFEKLANTNSFDNKDLASYLMIRSLIREATVKSEKNYDKQKLEKAYSKLKDILKTQNKYQEDLNKLKCFIEDRLQTKQRLIELGKSLTNNITENNLQEYISVFDILLNYDPYNFDSNTSNIFVDNLDAMSEWINSYQSNEDKAKQFCFNQFKQKKDILWTLAYLSHVSASDKININSINDFDNITIKFLKAQYLLNNNSIKNADTILNNLLADIKLDLSSKNLILDLKCQIAPTIEQFLKNSLSYEVGSWGGMSNEVPDQIDYPKSKKSQAILSLIPMAQSFINCKMPLSTMLQIYQSKKLNKESQTELIKAIYLRAFLLNDNSYLEKSANLIANDSITTKFDKNTRELAKRYINSKNSQEKKFLSGYILLNDSSFLPYIYYSSGYIGHYWWSSYDLTSLKTQSQDQDAATYQNIDINYIFPPKFLTKQEDAKATKEIATLQKCPTASVILPKLVIDYALINPNYPDIPRALHLAVNCTHYGERCKQGSLMSKQAFRLLHTKYKNSVYCKKTPYYY